MRWMLTDIDACRPVLMNVYERDRRCGSRTELLVYFGTHGSDRCRAESSRLTIAPNVRRRVRAW